MKRLDHILDKFEEYACFFTMLAMAVAVLLQIINRSFLGRPFPWGEELARYMMIWATFIGVSAGVKIGSHIGVDALTNRLPERKKLYFTIVTDLMLLVFYIAVTFLSVQIVIRIRSTNQLSPALRMPMWYAYLAMPVGFSLSCLRQLQRLLQKAARLFKSQDKEMEVL